MANDDELIERIRRHLASDAESGALPAVASEDAVAHAELVIGYALPPLLRRLYLEIANGGFGPAHGLVPLGREGSGRDRVGEFSLVGLYRDSCTSPDWPRGLLIAFDFGCAIWACVDATTVEGNIVNIASDDIAEMKWTLAEWLGAWVDGKSLSDAMFEPGTEVEHVGVHPFTRQPTLYRTPPRLRGARRRTLGGR
jgi:hypothetical protein